MVSGGFTDLSFATGIIQKRLRAFKVAVAIYNYEGEL